MIKLVYKHTIPNKLGTIPIFLLCVFRDESLLMERFIKYYRMLGVTHFVMIDNLSIDGGPNYLRLLKDVNIILYRADGSFKDAMFGVEWINICMKRHCAGQYCFAVDMDELFVFDTQKYRSLHDLIREMESMGANCVGATLLDMYPKKLNNNYQQGKSLIQHSPYFDDWNASFYGTKSILYDTFSWKVGGLRARIMGASPIVHKFPFVKYNFDPLGFNTGYHFFQYRGKVAVKANVIKVLKTPAVLLHFKYVKHDLLQVFKQRILNNQDWNNSSEYKLYVNALEKEKIVSFYDSRYSKKLSQINDLSKFFLLR